MMLFTGLLACSSCLHATHACSPLLTSQPSACAALCCFLAPPAHQFAFPCLLPTLQVRSEMASFLERRSALDKACHDVLTAQERDRDQQLTDAHVDQRIRWAGGWLRGLLGGWIGGRVGGQAGVLMGHLKQLPLIPASAACVALRAALLP